MAGDARSELSAASSPLPEGVWPSVWCLHAQRAAEKAIKAVLELRRTDLDHEKRKTHNIERLVAFLELPEVPVELRAARRLTAYAVETHYVDDLGEPSSVTVEDLDEAVKVAREVVEWAASVVESA